MNDRALLPPDRAAARDRGLQRIELALTAQEIALLEVLLTVGRSRPLARRMGRDRETLKRWQDGLRLKLTLAVKRATLEDSGK